MGSLVFGSQREFEMENKTQLRTVHQVQIDCMQRTTGQLVLQHQGPVRSNTIIELEILERLVQGSLNVGGLMPGLPAGNSVNWVYKAPYDSRAWLTV